MARYNSSLGNLRNVKGNVMVQWPFRPGSAAREGVVPLSVIDGMPIKDYLERVKHQILGAEEHRRFDTRVIVAAQDVTAGHYDFFDKKIRAADEKSLDGSITIASKDEAFTNMIEEGKIEAGYALIVDSVQVGLCQTHREFGGFTANMGQPSTLAPSATDTTSATNTVVGLCRTVYLSLTENREKWKVEGRLDAFPSDRIKTGAFGCATAEGFIQIGAGQPNYLRAPIVLQEGHHFDVDLHFVRTITCPMNVEISVELCGLLVEV